MMIEETIERVENLFRGITGTEPPRADGPYAPIPPEKDPIAYVEEELARLQRLVGVKVGRTTVPEAGAVSVPALDVIESDAEYLFLVDLPGVQSGQVQVTVRDFGLTIVAERPAPKLEQAAVRHIERPYGRIVRPVALPPNVKAQEATARLCAGVLEIRVPKGAPAPTEVRTIEVK